MSERWKIQTNFVHRPESIVTVKTNEMITSLRELPHTPDMINLYNEIVHAHNEEVEKIARQSKVEAYENILIHVSSEFHTKQDILDYAKEKFQSHHEWLRSNGRNNVRS